MNKIHLDPARLYGFRILDLHLGDARIAAKVGEKPNARIGGKVGGKPIVRLGSKIGGKVGTKPGQAM